MTDTIYTPHEMLGLLADYITARRAKYDALCVEIDVFRAKHDTLCAEIDALCVEIDALRAERDVCDSEISAAHNALASF